MEVCSRPPGNQGPEAPPAPYPLLLAEGESQALPVRPVGADGSAGSGREAAIPPGTILMLTILPASSGPSRGLPVSCPWAFATTALPGTHPQSTQSNLKANRTKTEREERKERAERKKE